MAQQVKEPTCEPDDLGSVPTYTHITLYMYAYTRVCTHNEYTDKCLKKGKDLLRTDHGIYKTYFYHFLLGQSKPPDSRVQKRTPHLNS